MVRSTLMNAVAGMSAAAMLTCIVGCQDDNKPAYGSGTRTQLVSEKPPVPTDDAIPPTTIPAGAKRLSQGTYNQILFTVPSGEGSLYVYDVDSKQIVGQTNSVEAMAGKSMTMADLKNTAQGLNMTDKYQIYFAPSIATTKPIGGM